MDEEIPPQAPSLLIKPTNGKIDDIFKWFFNPDTRTVYLLSIDTDSEGNESCIGAAAHSYLTKALDYLEGQNSDEITFILNSPGGSWNDALGIYDRLLRCPCPTKMEVYGSVFSGAPVILQAADRRLMSSNSTMLIHNGSISLGNEETLNAEQWADFSKRIERPRMYRILSRRSIYTQKEISDKCKEGDWFLTPSEALKAGFIDKIISPKDYGADNKFARFSYKRKENQDGKEGEKEEDI